MTGTLDVNDDAELHVEEVIASVSEDCQSHVCHRSLDRAIGRRDNLRNDVGSRSLGRGVKGQILLHRVPGGFGALGRAKRNAM